MSYLKTVAMTATGLALMTSGSATPGFKRAEGARRVLCQQKRDGCKRPADEIEEDALPP